MYKSTANRAINRTDEIKEEIIKLLSKDKRHFSTQEISDIISRPWHSVQNRCLRLQLEGVIDGFRVGRINLWQYKLSKVNHKKHKRGKNA